MEYVFDLSDLYEYYIEKVLDLLNRELDPNYDAMAKGSLVVDSVASPSLGPKQILKFDSTSLLHRKKL
jgi:hypothetical protein